MKLFTFGIGISIWYWCNTILGAISLFNGFFKPPLPYLSSVHADGEEGEHAEGHRQVRHVVVHLAVQISEYPDPAKWMIIAEMTTYVSHF